MAFREIQNKHVRRAAAYALFVYGWVTSMWLTPRETLNVPNTQVEGGFLSLAYYPINPLFLVVLFIPLFYILFYWWRNNEETAKWSSDKVSGRQSFEE